MAKEDKQRFSFEPLERTTFRDAFEKEVLERIQSKAPETRGITLVFFCQSGSGEQTLNIYRVTNKNGESRWYGETTYIAGPDASVLKDIGAPVWGGTLHDAAEDDVEYTDKVLFERIGRMTIRDRHYEANKPYVLRNFDLSNLCPNLVPVRSVY